MGRWSFLVHGKDRTETIEGTLSKLRFETAPVETLYLDETRVHEDLIGQVGAIEAFTRLATKEGSGGVETPVLKIDAAGSSEANVTWNLSHPIVQVLVLRALLKSQGTLRDINYIHPGEYIAFTRTGMISRPGMFDGLQRERLQEFPGFYQDLEDIRAAREKEMWETGGSKEHLWLLTINDGTSICASTLMGDLLRPPFRHWIHVDSPWEITGLCREIDASKKVAWLAPLYLCAKF